MRYGCRSRRMTVTASAAVSALVFGAVLSCAHDTFMTAGSDGGLVDGAMPVDGSADTWGAVRVVFDWPTAPPLDPSRDPRAGPLKVSVSDGADPMRTVSRDVAFPYPASVEFDRAPLGPRAVAVVEVNSSDRSRLIAYGSRAAAAPGDIPVHVRRRLLYVADSDGRVSPAPGEARSLRAFDLAPAGEPEPAVHLGFLGTIAGVDSPVGVYATGDGDRIVIAGKLASGGLVQILSTSTDDELRRIPLSGVPGALLRVGDGTHGLVGLDDANSATNALELIDLDAGTATLLTFNPGTGGVFQAHAAVASKDGARAYVVGEMSTGGATLLVVDVKMALDGHVGTSVIVRALGALEAGRGVRLSSDESKILVVGTTTVSSGLTTGHVQQWDAATLALDPGRDLSLGADRTSPTSFVLHPDGSTAFIANGPQYPVSGICCAAMTVVDTSGWRVVSDTALYGVSAAIVTFDGRVVGGQTYWANDRTSDIVDATKTTIDPTPMSLEGYTGNVIEMATPFGRRL